MSGNTGTEIVRQDQGGALARPEGLDLGVPVEQLIARVEKIAEVQNRVMKPDHHFGVVPGTNNKPSLFKPGAELLCMTFQLAPDFSAEDRWDGEHLECVVKCTLIHGPTEVKVGSGIGSCSTRESKYAYRNARRKCPSCGSDAALNKSKQKPEFYCWAKKGGCGATFPLTDKRITGQEVGRVPNPDLADQYNTVRKMASKRALVAAVLITCGASHLFTQDVEDMPRDGSPANDDAGGGGGNDYDDSWREPSDAGAKQQRQQSNGGDSKDKPTSAQHTSRMTAEFLSASTLEALESLVPQLQQLKDDRCLTLDDYKKLRAAYSARATALKDSARQSA